MQISLIDSISKYFESQPVEKAWIFGSYARSEENSRSDLDILVSFCSGSKVTLFKYIHIINDLQKLTGKRVDLVEKGQLKPFAENSAENDKILIYERKA
ncbi:MAG: nucleotidyltransferase domain-containing protein [Bacteroidetes bacterium]|nr:nucleotidyltransferase domain-containing protein [Bacteroidota bacterium]